MFCATKFEYYWNCTLYEMKGMHIIDYREHVCQTSTPRFSPFQNKFYKSGQRQKGVDNIIFIKKIQIFFKTTFSVCTH